MNKISEFKNHQNTSLNILGILKTKKERILSLFKDKVKLGLTGQNSSGPILAWNYNTCG